MTGFTAPNHTQTPNDLFDTHMRDMTESELKVTLAVIRKTLGYHKKSDPLSWSQIMEMTGLSKDATQNGIEKALKRGLIQIIGRGKRGINIFGLVINSDQSEINTSTGSKNIPDDALTGTKFRHTKETIKQTSKKKSAHAQPSQSDTPKVTFPKLLKNYDANHIMAYQQQHTADMTALVHAWQGEMFNSITEFTCKVGRQYIEVHQELVRLAKPSADYLALANYTKKKDAWKDSHVVTDMLSYVAEYKQSTSWADIPELRGITEIIR